MRTLQPSKRMAKDGMESFRKTNQINRFLLSLTGGQCQIQQIIALLLLCLFFLPYKIHAVSSIPKPFFSRIMFLMPEISLFMMENSCFDKIIYKKLVTETELTGKG